MSVGCIIALLAIHSDEWYHKTSIEKWSIVSIRRYVRCFSIPFIRKKSVYMIRIHFELFFYYYNEASENVSFSHLFCTNPQDWFLSIFSFSIFVHTRGRACLINLLFLYCSWNMNFSSVFFFLCLCFKVTMVVAASYLTK